MRKTSTTIVEAPGSEIVLTVTHVKIKNLSNLSTRIPMTKEVFETLPPRQRGFAVYMWGCRTDEPNIPDEECPYPEGSAEYSRWVQGQIDAVNAVHDTEE